MGRTRRLGSALIAIGTLAAGCGGAAAEQNDVRNLAAYDLHCPAAQIELTQLQGCWNCGPGSQGGASGCGRRARYVFTQHGWVANTVTSDAPSSGSEQPPAASSP
jgi:hypothetical protein